MSRYLLLMRGDQTGFLAMSSVDKKKRIAEHLHYSKELQEKKIFIDGVGCFETSVILSKHGRSIKMTKNPFAGTDDQLSGFYIIQAKNDEEAVKIAKECPALVHGETVEVVKLGH